MKFAIVITAFCGYTADAEDLPLELVAHAADEVVCYGGDAEVDGFH